MDSSFLLYSPKSSLSTSLPLFLPHKSRYVENQKFFVKPHYLSPTKHSDKSEFLGRSLIFRQGNVKLDNLGKNCVPFRPVTAAVKRRKELPFDNVIQKDKKLKLVLKIRKILVSQSDRTMSLKQMGKYRRDLGLQKKRRLIALLRKFPAVFEIVEEGVFSLKFKLTPEAEKLYLEEMRVRNEMEALLVVKLRKLLMMSLDKRILLEKIAHLKTDLGLPLEFRDTICHRYPQYFRVVATERGPALELTHFDPELAVSAAELAEEENRARELEEKNLIIDRPMKFHRVKLPKGLNLSKGEMRKICQFRDIPYITPYSDFSALRAGTPEKEKHACGVVHEILSLTIEKRTLVDHLTHFREEFRFSQQLRGMLIRHPDMFYVSLKGDRDSVFLREAYRDSHLIDKDRLLIIKEKLRSLVSVPRYPRRGAPKREADNEETSDPLDESVEGEDWSDIDDLLGDDELDEEDEEDDGEGDYNGDWSEDDDLPPNFEEDGEVAEVGMRKAKQVGHKTESDKTNLTPVYSDGQPRDRW